MYYPYSYLYILCKRICKMNEMIETHKKSIIVNVVVCHVTPCKLPKQPVKKNNIKSV